MLSVYPCRPKAEAFDNAVDVVIRLHDPTDPSTKSTVPPRSALLIQLSVEGEFRQHDGVKTVMMKLPVQGFA